MSSTTHTYLHAVSRRKNHCLGDILWSLSFHLFKKITSSYLDTLWSNYEQWLLTASSVMDSSQPIIVIIPRSNHLTQHLSLKVVLQGGHIMDTQMCLGELTWIIRCFCSGEKCQRLHYQDWQSHLKFHTSFFMIVRTVEPLRSFWLLHKIFKDFHRIDKSSLVVNTGSGQNLR